MQRTYFSRVDQKDAFIISVWLSICLPIYQQTPCYNDEARIYLKIQVIGSEV